MGRKTISLSIETKELLEAYIDKYKFATADQCVKAMLNFFKKNGINSDDVYLGDLDIKFVRFEKNVLNISEKQLASTKADNQSLRKMLGAFERDYLKPLKDKFSLLEKISEYEIDNIKQERIEESKSNNPLNNGIITTYKNEDFENKLTKEKEKFSALYKKYDEQNRTLYKIFNNFKIEQGGLVSKEKIVITLSVSEWDNLKK